MLLFHSSLLLFFFFFNDTATTEIYTLSLHDALPISLMLFQKRFLIHLNPQRLQKAAVLGRQLGCLGRCRVAFCQPDGRDRKSTRLNSSHSQISYAVFCLKKKKKK